MAGTATDKDNWVWLAGFISRTKGETRPGSGLKRQGWDAADKMLKDSSGGYGPSN